MLGHDPVKTSTSQGTRPSSSYVCATALWNLHPNVRVLLSDGLRGPGLARMLPALREVPLCWSLVYWFRTTPFSIRKSGYFSTQTIDFFGPERSSSFRRLYGGVWLLKNSSYSLECDPSFGTRGIGSSVVNFFLSGRIEECGQPANSFQMKVQIPSSPKALDSRIKKKSKELLIRGQTQRSRIRIRLTREISIC